MIRPATWLDVDALVDLGCEFGIKSQAAHKMPVSIESIRLTIYFALQNPETTVLLVSENAAGKIEGVVFGIVVAAFFSEEKVLQEMALYSRSTRKLMALVEAFEVEAKRLNIRKVVMGMKPGYCDLSRIYGRRGYNLFEQHFLKQVV